jgi:hypothetical protein
MFEQLDEAGARVDRVSPADGGVVEFGDHFNAGGLGVGGHGLALPAFAVLVRADVSGG